MKIYVLGNPLVKEDSYPLELIPQLSKIFPWINFERVDPNENFPLKSEKKIIILDTIIGISQPVILDLDDLEEKGKTPVSLHDYDLLFHLLLLKKTGRLGQVIIIGIPELRDKSLIGQVSDLISRSVLGRK